MKDLLKQLLDKAEEIAESWHERHGSMDEDEISYELTMWLLKQEGVEDYFYKQYGNRYDEELGKWCDRAVEGYFDSVDYQNFLTREAENERDEIERKQFERDESRRSKQI